MSVCGNCLLITETSIAYTYVHDGYIYIHTFIHMYAYLFFLFFQIFFIFFAIAYNTTGRILSISFWCLRVFKKYIGVACATDALRLFLYPGIRIMKLSSRPADSDAWLPECIAAFCIFSWLFLPTKQSILHPYFLSPSSTPSSTLETAKTFFTTNQ